jgi:hypothetical protein
MHFPLLSPDEPVTFAISVVWFLWFVIVGIFTGWLMAKFQPIVDEHDAYRRVLFTFLVVFTYLVLGRLPQTYITYDQIFREGFSVVWWSTAPVLGVALYTLVWAKNKYLFGK